MFQVKIFYWTALGWIQKNLMTKKLDNFPSDVLSTVSKLCSIDRNTLIIELQQFSNQFETLIKNKKNEIVDLDYEDQNETDNEDDEGFIGCLENRQCYNCLSCAFPIIYELSQNGIFLNLYSAYKFVITLPCTQVTCERVFSKIKIVKNRLRSALSQELLFELMLMNVERDLFYNLDKNLIIDKIAATSDELKKN